MGNLRRSPDPLGVPSPFVSLDTFDYSNCSWTFELCRGLSIIMWVSTSPGEYRYVGFFEVAGDGRVLAPPTAGNAAV